jgi:hypothetical protein
MMSVAPCAQPYTAGLGTARASVSKEVLLISLPLVRRLRPVGRSPRNSLATPGVVVSRLLGVVIRRCRASERRHQRRRCKERHNAAFHGHLPSSDKRREASCKSRFHLSR